MNYQINPYAVVQFAAAGITLVLLTRMWKRRGSRGGRCLFFQFVAVFIWILAAGFEAAAVGQNLKVFWSVILYIGSMATPVIYYLFTREYSGKFAVVEEDKIWLLFLIPAAIVTMAATNQWHGLIWPAFQPGPAGTNSLVYEHGIFFWVAMAYAFVLVASGSHTLFVSSVQSQGIYKRQNRLFALAALFPIVAAFLYLTNLNPFPGLDLVPIGFMFTGVFLLLAMGREKLLDLVPVSHEFLLENIDDGILVVDESMRILDVNAATEDLLGISSDEVIGQSAHDHIPFWGTILSKLHFERGRKFEVEVELPNINHLRVNISPMATRNDRFLGWVLVLENISLRKKIEQDLQKANKKLETQIDEIKLLQDQLQYQAVRDTLTGTFNRGYMDDTLVRETARAQRKGYPLTIFMIDVDRFKAINDALGHHAGDAVIKDIGQLLMGQTRQSDCVCRYGGDEFVVILPEMNAECAQRRAEDLRQLFKSTEFAYEGKILNSTISIGIAVFPRDGVDAESLVIAADNALYAAKQAGRDCVQVAVS